MTTGITDFATIDFETFYDKDFSLSKMQTDEYILDDRFEIIGVSAKAGRHARTEWYSGEQRHVKEFLQDTIDWENTPVCAQHTHFDGFIATQILDLQPLMWLDTLSLARMHYPWWKSHSLANIAEELGLGQKGHQVHQYKGFRREDFTTSQLRDYGNYCNNDVALTHTIGELLLDRTPLLELVLIDMTIRMFTEPQLYGDTDRLIAYHKSEVERKDKLLASVGVDITELRSNNKFAQLLLDCNVVPPTKVSPVTGKTAYAFAKTDKNFTELLEHPDEDVQALVAARMGVKSTIAETRALRFVHTSQRGAMPVYLAHWGAKTTGRLCLAGDTTITVMRGTVVLDVALDRLLPYDLVWDGICFSAHGGLIDRGQREVISYGGITGTPDHRVYCEELFGEAIALSSAMSHGYTLEAPELPTEHKARAS